MATSLLSPSMARDITMLMGDATARPKLKRYITKLKREKQQAEEEAKLRFEDKLKADLKAALKEIKDADEGRTQLRDARELLDEL